MWEAVIGGAGGLVGLYVAVRQEVRRSHDVLLGRLDQTDARLDRFDGRFDRMDIRFDRLETELRADIRGLDEKVEGARAELSAGIRHLDEKLGADIRHLDEKLGADIQRVDGKIDTVRGELIRFLGPRAS